MEVALIVLFLLLLFACATSSAPRIIPIPSELRPATISSSVWLSESGAFAFGFYGYSVSVFLTSVSFKRPVVWAPTFLDPVLPTKNLSLEINRDGIQLSRYDGDGRRYTLHDIATTNEAVAGASILDHGNFVLFGFDGGVLWESFDYPTDTLLPGQRLPMGQELFSRSSAVDLGRGKFRLKMQSDGNLAQYPAGAADTAENAYYNSGTHRAGGGNLSLNLDSVGRLHLYDGNSSYYNLTGPTGGDGVVYLARVDPDGIFRLYSRFSDGEPTVVWSSTEDRCVPKGICGDNSLCSYDGNETVACTCLPGFSANDDGCTLGFDVKECGREDSSVGYEMKTVWKVTWKDNYYAVNDTVVGEEGCARACLDDCDCVVALYKRGKCRKQRLPFKYGRRSFRYSNAALVRVPLPALPRPPPYQSPNASPNRFGRGPSGVHKYVIIGVSIGIAALVISSIIIYYLIKPFFSQDEESKQNVDKLVLNHGSLALKRYSYKEIKKITKSFTEKVGQGGYGIVYKGKLPDAQLVAVKVLTKIHSNGDEFLNEVASISRTSHVNIVNLLGFCVERKKRALVYEFMPNQSLDKYIFSSGSVNEGCSLEWSKLYEIAVGIARGLEYLHKGCNTRIVHFDIKPQNILLDQNLRPKIADFGLAKLCMKTQSAISVLGTRGTIGYIAPEVFSRNFGTVSHKSDVYSYGIVLLQMAKARTNVEIKSFESSEDFLLVNMYKHVLVQNEKLYAKIREEEEEAVRKMLMVGFWCTQTAPSDRPSMNKVVDMLQGNSRSIHIPPLPFLMSSPKPEFSSLQLSITPETQSSIVG